MLDAGDANVLLSTQQIFAAQETEGSKFRVKQLTFSHVEVEGILCYTKIPKVFQLDSVTVLPKSGSLVRAEENYVVRGKLRIDANTKNPIIEDAEIIHCDETSSQHRKLKFDRLQTFYFGNNRDDYSSPPVSAFSSGLKKLESPIFETRKRRLETPEMKVKRMKLFKKEAKPDKDALPNLVVSFLKSDTTHDEGEDFDAIKKATSTLNPTKEALVDALTKLQNDCVIYESDGKYAFI